MLRLLKPKIVQDITPNGGDVFKDHLPRLNLSYRQIWRVPLTRIVQVGVMAVGVLFLLLGSATAPTIHTLAKSTQEERQALEAQLKALENQIDQYEGQIVSYQNQGKTLKGEIANLNNKVAKLNLQLRAINLTLTQLDQKISDTQFQISGTEEGITRNREALSQLLRNVYTGDHSSLLEVFLKNPKLSDFFDDLNNVALLQNNLRVSIDRITDLQNQLKENETQLSLARADAATVKAYQASQRQEAQEVQKEKQNILAATKGQESKFQSLLTKTREDARKIRSRIFELLGGGELTFEQAYQYAKVAATATGVRAAVILAILDRESALGQNVGRCSYQTAMSPNNQTVFLSLTQELNINPDTVMVSCPNADGPYGGAMGPAQFIPSTWVLYKDSITRITGHTPPSPWNNADAFVATALYLRDAGAATNEKVAAAKYYCGSRWSRYVCTNVYGRKVVEQANRFQQDIETITAQ